MAQEKIDHPALITKIEEGILTVQIEVQEACGNCAARRVCGSGENKTFEVIDDGLDRKVGDHVTLSITRSMGIQAMIISYMIPVILIIGVISLLTYLDLSDMIVGGSALGVTALYFFVLWFFRDRLLDQITIEIE